MAIAFLIVAQPVHAVDELVGSFEPGLIAGNPGIPILCRRVQRTPQDGIPEIGDAEVFRGSLWVPLRSGHELRVPLLLVEPNKARNPYVYVDSDRDGTFLESERFLFRETRRGFGEVYLELQAPTGSAFSHFPVRLVLPGRDFKHNLPPADRYLLQSITQYVTAKVQVARQQLFFRYGISADASPDVDLRYSTQMVDKGQLNVNNLSPLRALGKGEFAVFRIGNRYVSTESIDLEKRTVQLRWREPDDYRRLELRRGLVIPDFPFEDLDGRSRRLSEFLGRYILLNFWYPHCGPCVDELVYTRIAQERFEARGFSVIGLGTTGTATVVSNGFSLSPASIRAYLTELRVDRVEATPLSVSRIVDEWFMINAMPTMILLDPVGRIISLNQDQEGKLPLRGPGLLKTLDSVLPR